MTFTLRIASAAALVAVLAACGGSTSPESSTTTDTNDATPAAQLEVAAAFYPLELAAARIGGERVAVTPMTKPGVEPHDLELTPKDVAALASSDLVVYLAGFQPAVDDAVASTAPDAGFDVAPFARLTITAADDGHDHGHEDEHGHEEEHGHEDEAEEHEGEGALDPHFWLDPTRYAEVAEAIRDQLTTVDPDGAAEYTANATAFVAELDRIDGEFMTGLETCTHRDLVTGHAAFAYLADRYDLHQVGIAGLSPDNEPSPAQIRDLVEHVREAGVTTVYAETLVSPALTETIAREAGVQVKVLDPIEGITDESAGTDYFEVMTSNLQTLQAGQECTTS